jgi:hypothetical protein
MSADFGPMAEWFNRVGYCADLAIARREYRGIAWHSFKNWAKE